MIPIIKLNVKCFYQLVFSSNNNSQSILSHPNFFPKLSRPFSFQEMSITTLTVLCVANCFTYWAFGSPVFKKKYWKLGGSWCQDGLRRVQ